MFAEFAAKKFDEYIKQIEFQQDKTSLQLIKRSELPPYLTNFFECSLGYKKHIIERAEAEDLLKRGLTLYINYVIKPKGTLLKFMFGNVETRPAEYVFNKLHYFRFYSYYITHISDFIVINQLPVISSAQAEALINQVNRKIYEEISSSGNRIVQRENLVKLLFYFFLDLTDNNLINIKLPKKILSVFFQDKGFIDIKNAVDDFFKDDIYIQEAIDLMDPVNRKQKRKSKDPEEEIVKDIVSKAKSSKEKDDAKIPGLSITLSEADSAEIISKKTEIKDEEIRIKEIKLIEDSDLLNTDSLKEKTILSGEFYSDDLQFASSLQPAKEEISLSPEELKEKKFSELFCELSFRNRIIKKLFKKDEKLFKETVMKMLDSVSWQEAAGLIENLFEKNRVDYYSEDAVRFVDIIESYFTENTQNSSLKSSGPT